MPTSCPVVVGRERELGILRTALAETRAGQGRVIALMGEAGVGKSRLARLLAAEAAHQNLAVLRGRSVESESGVSFRPLAEALQAWLRRSGLPNLSEIDLPELQPYLPALGQISPDLRGGDPVVPDEPLVVVSEGVVRLFRAVASSRPVLLVLEDLHWADPETLGVVDYLSDHLPGEPVLCVLTVRDETPSPARLLMHSLAARRSIQCLDLRRLEDPDVDRMARACLRASELPTGLSQYLRAPAEGLPFLVEELLAAAVTSAALVRSEGRWEFREPRETLVPDSVADTVERRLSVLGPNTRQVLTAAAVLGRCFDSPLLSAMTGLSEREVLDALRGAVAAQLVVPQAGTSRSTYHFRHALTRDAVVAQLLPSDRAALAARAVAAIEAAYPGLPGAWCHLAAQLSEEAGDTPKAARLLLEAGRRALATGALATAERMLEEAARGADAALRVEVDRVLVEVLALMGKTDRVREVGERLLAQLERVDAAPRDCAILHLHLARAAATATSWAEARRHLERARVLAAFTPAADLLPSVHALGANVALGENRLEEAANLAHSALSFADHRGLREPRMAVTACEALEVLGRRARMRDPHEAESAFTQALDIAEAHHLPLWRLRALHELGTIDLFETFRLDRLSEARDLARKEGAVSIGAFVDLALAAILVNRLELDRALGLARGCADAARRFGLGLLLPTAHTLEAAVHALAQSRDEMERSIERALAAAPSDPNVSAGVWGQCRAELSFLSGDRAAAMTQLETAMRFVRRPGTDAWPFQGLWVLLRTVEDGGVNAREELRASPGATPRLNRAYLAYADAVSWGRLGDAEVAQDLFALAEREISGLEGTVWQRDRARCLVAEAALRDGWGDPVAWLQAALQTFLDHGHAAMATHARGLLRKAGAAVPRRTSDEALVPVELRVLGVTAREMDVLTLIGERLSNRQIASRLYLSPRTVEKHVERLLGKLGVSGRGELAGVLRTRGGGASRSSDSHAASARPHTAS